MLMLNLNLKPSQNPPLKNAEEKCEGRGKHCKRRRFKECYYKTFFFGQRLG